MSLIFNQFNEQAPVPQIHVLMIGVGGYPYLQGGLSQLPQQFDAAQQMGQLTSPPVSVEAFYTAIMHLHNANSWIKPLGSVEVLISQAPGAKDVFTAVKDVSTGLPIEHATMQNIRNAYGRWKKRCDSLVDNVAIFFFCGHGLEKGEHFLLAEDFGSNPALPWSECFAFDMTRKAFHSCKAKTQLFFIDACREVTPDMIDYEISAMPLDIPSIKKHTESQYNLTQKAAAANELAYSKVNEPSFYTKALISALKGSIATRVDGNWKVFTAGLSANMTDLMRMEAEEEGYPQRCVSTITDTTELVRLQGPPDVKLNVSCDPELALACAILTCTDPVTNEIKSRVPADPAPWIISVRAGVYKVAANFQNGNYINRESLIPVLPPSTNEKLVCV